MLRRMAHGLALFTLVASLGAAQGPNNSEATLARSSSAPTLVRTQAGKPKPYQVGTASWYGEYFQGRPTATGESYDMYDMTAAHPSIPLGSYVKVTNLHNGRAVVVRINDRGPVVEGRIIDLSYGAAKVLGYDKKGLQRVRIDIVPRSSQVVAGKGVAYQTVALNHPVKLGRP
jgi:rare lipoprotein A